MSKHTTDTVRHRYSWLQFAVTIVVIVLLVCVVAAQFAGLTQSIDTLRDGYAPYVGAALACWVSTVVAAAWVYMALALKPLRFWPTLCVQTASGFVNKLVPAGAGALAVWVRYLLTQGHNGAGAASVALLNNVLGFVGMAALLAIAAYVGGGAWPRVSIGLAAWVWIGVFVGAGVTGAVLYASRRGFRRLARRLFASLGGAARNFGRRPWRLVIALVASLAVTSGYAACLWFAALAFNVHVSVSELLVVLAAGVAAGSVAPTPGGLGGAEAGLTAAFATLDVPMHQALAVIFAFRFVTYWLPMVPGFVCFRIAQKQRLI